MGKVEEFSLLLCVRIQCANCIRHSLLQNAQNPGPIVVAMFVPHTLLRPNFMAPIDGTDDGIHNDGVDLKTQRVGQHFDNLPIEIY